MNRQFAKKAATHVATIALVATSMTGSGFAAEGAVPAGVPHLDHVFVIMMENHGYQQIINNPSAPFINKLAKTANSAINYFAVAHPSLTNYLEVVGGSNFGVLSDNPPDWHNASCLTNLATGTVNNEATSSPICPIYGTGTDAATPAIDYSNETSGPPGDVNINGTKSIPADHAIHALTIADQMANNGMTWKSYQENLPLGGADYVNYSDGTYTNLSTVPAPMTQNDVVQLYAAKHDPFVYFRSVQDGENPALSFRQIRPFDGAGGLYADLGSGHVPNYSFIAPNQCDDMHGRGNAGLVCNYDPTSTGTQTGLNPALIHQGDVTVARLVTAIKSSPAWSKGNNAIVILWDENDYSVAPITNQVLLIVDTNYGKHGVASPVFYDHFSLLRTIEAGLGVPCLNHACDPGTKVMSDLFN